MRVGIEVTPEAAQVLRRSLELGNVGTSGGIRLRGSRALGGGFEVQVELSDGPADGDAVIEQGGLRLFIEPSVTENVSDAVVALDPQHDTVSVRPR